MKIENLASDFQRIEALDLLPGDYPLLSFIDKTNGYIYTVSDDEPARIVKISIDPLSRISSVDLDINYRYIYSGVIDTIRGFLYLGNDSDTIIKVRLSDLTVYDTLVTSLYNIQTAIIDEPNGIAYFGGRDLGYIVKVDLLTFTITDTVQITSPAPYGFYAAGIDTANGYGYFTTDYGDGSTIPDAVKIRLSDMTEIANIFLPSGENFIGQVYIDSTNNICYLANFGQFVDGGAGDLPNKIIKTDISDTNFSRISYIEGIQRNYTGVIDKTRGFLYLAGEGSYTGTPPGKITKIDLSTFSIVDSFDLESGEDLPVSGVIYEETGFAYFALKYSYSPSVPPRIVKIAIALPSAIEVLADSSWPKFAYDIRNTGRRPPPNPEPENTAYRIPKWWVNLPSGTIAAPAIAADNTVYVAGMDGILYAINPDGNFKWGYNTGSTLFATPAIALDETIYIGADNSYLYAINPNGTAKWAYGLLDSIQSSPAIADDNTIYINSFGGRLWAITDLGDSGVLKWTSHTIGAGYASYNPVTVGTNKNIYVGSAEGILEAINPVNGTLVWSYNIGDLLETCPAISDTGVIYVGDYAGKLHSIFPDGTPVSGWPHVLGSGAASSPSLIYTGNVRTVYVATYNGILYAIDTDIDDSSYYNIKWSTSLPGDITASPTIGSDGTIYIGTLAGIFYAINPIDGSIRWSYTTFGQVRGSAAIDPNGVVYVGSAEQDEFGNYISGRLYAFAPPSEISAAGCPGNPKYSGDTVTLQSTPKDGIGPYYVEFRKDGVVIDPSRLVDELGNPTTNPIIDSPEYIQLTRVYTLNDIDIAGATGGTIDFSVHIEDKCPTGAKTCTESCIITAGCIAPVCNFTVS